MQLLEEMDRQPKHTLSDEARKRIDELAQQSIQIELGKIHETGEVAQRWFRIKSF